MCFYYILECLCQKDKRHRSLRATFKCNLNIQDSRFYFSMRLKIHYIKSLSPHISISHHISIFQVKL